MLSIERFRIGFEFRFLGDVYVMKFRVFEACIVKITRNTPYDQMTVSAFNIDKTEDNLEI